MPFGNNRALVLHSAAECVAAAERFGWPLNDISFRSGTDPQAIYSGVRIGRLVLRAIRSTPGIYASKSEPELSFQLPVFGSGVTEYGVSETRWSALDQIQIMSLDRSFKADVTTPLLMIAITPDEEELNRQLQSLSSDEVDFSQLIDRVQAIGNYQRPGIINGMNFRSMLFDLISLIDKADCNEEHLRRIGVDDVIMRVLADFVIAQNGVVQQDNVEHRVPRSAKAVDIICDHIMQNIGYPLTISKMEKLSGLSGRAINYAFQQRFNCSPQEWQRGVLLEEARRRLSSNDLVSIKALSNELGFSSASSFAAHYKKKFGELPTETATRVAPLSEQKSRQKVIM